MDILLETLLNSKSFGSYIKDVKSEKLPIMLSGLNSVAKVQMMSATTLFAERPIIYISANELEARKIVEDFRNFNKEAKFFPKREIKNFDTFAESKENLFERVNVLNNLIEQKINVVVTTIDAITQPMILPNDLYKNKINIKIDEVLDLSEIIEKLVSLGYERQDLIDGTSSFSVRGGILDISLSEERGVRIELWDDEVESIRIFNTLTQRSTEEIDNIVIYPATEFVINRNLKNIEKDISDISATGKILSDITDDIMEFKEGKYKNKIEKYFSKFYPEYGTLLDYITKDYIVVLDEANKIQNRIENINKDNKLVLTNLYEKNRYGNEALELQQSYQAFSKKIEKQNNNNLIYLSEIDIDILDKQSTHAKRNGYSFNYREVNFFRNSLDIIFEEITKSVKNKDYIFLLGGSNSNSLKEFLEENGIKDSVIIKTRVSEKNHRTSGFNTNNISSSKIKVNDFDVNNIKKSTIYILDKELSSGFYNSDTKVLVIDFNELFLRKKQKKRKTTTYRKSEKIRYSDLESGDFVVHNIHGIGRFIEILKMTTMDITRDYIKIEYRGGDYLYVPTNALDNVRKYISKDGIVPRLSKLGTKDWEKAQNKVRNRLREVAEELILLYAERENQKGFAFSKDTIWQKELEDSFEYIETEDQLRCVEEIKSDMVKPIPMDRLLCGDVGFGKTEVAIRAAFKAVQDSKQVAYLVPTTILAKQQYEEFARRMKDFPVKIDFLSRFKTPKQQKEIIKDLKDGNIDIVVGTHRLLSEDVKFNDLGLLVIDEEHRFGVGDKEKIKMLKKSIDVLSMTATPIPRTINMSLSGIRDMSIIYDPPINRKSVKTYVLEYDEDIIKEAIISEVERGGQVFYLYNKVKGIEAKRDKLKKLMPNVKFAFAHGQMSSRQIEDIMESFINKEIDVLVSTTIMESGIDIPSANTIVVEDADRLGLAQLYQIRGRVGRSEKQAYAYITFKKDKVLSEVSEKRLKAIKEFTELGSGFKIAMRDLEIRGAGSILGELQHGHMEQVGYETYMSILQEVIKETRGEKVEKPIEILIDLNVSQYIPDEYIESEKVKIDVYQEIFAAEDKEELEEVKQSIVDRFGKYGEELENLFNVALIQIKAKRKKIEKINQRNDRVFFYLPEKYVIENLEALINEYKHNLRFSKSDKNYISVDFLNYKKNKLAMAGMKKDDIIDVIENENFNTKTQDIIEFLEML